jgi:hypothetical protein
MKKIKNIALAGLLAATILPSIAQAENGINGRSFADVYTECGLGGMIGSADKGSKSASVVAIVTNATWDLGTTASLSALTTPDTCYNNNALSARLINQGYDNIEQELAVGDGKYLRALASLNKNSSQTEIQYISSLREDFSSIVTAEGYNKASHYDKAEALFNTLQ